MNRRVAIKSLGMFTSGMILLPSCDFSEEKVSLALHKLQITSEQEKLLKDLVGTIIPEGEIPGAGSLEVHNFVWIMIDDCFDGEKQKSFLTGLDLFATVVKNDQSKSFSDLKQEDRLTLLENILKKRSKDGVNESNYDDEAVHYFLNTTKNYTIWGYMQSKYIMTEIMPYELVPGSFDNCRTIDNNKRINVNG